MKKSASILAVAALLSATANAQPIVYGKANVSLQLADEAGNSALELKSNASRLGVKGDYAIEGTGLTAIYKMEFETQFDDGDKDGQTFSQRNIYLGLTGGFGTVKAGMFDTPLKLAQKKVDLFNDLEGDIKNVITANDNRVKNVVSYSTAKDALGPLNATVAIVASEDEDLDEGISASVDFNQNGIYAAVAIDQNIEEQDANTVRLVGQYSFSKFKIGALIEQYSPAEGDSSDGWLLSGQYSPNKWAFKVQVGESDIKAENGQTYSVGADYKLSKKFKTFAYATLNESGPEASSVENNYLGLGAELKF